MKMHIFHDYIRNIMIWIFTKKYPVPLHWNPFFGIGMSKREKKICDMGDDLETKPVPESRMRLHNLQIAQLFKSLFNF